MSDLAHGIAIGLATGADPTVRQAWKILQALIEAGDPETLGDIVDLSSCTMIDALEKLGCDETRIDDFNMELSFMTLEGQSLIGAFDVDPDALQKLKDRLIEAGDPLASLL